MDFMEFPAVFWSNFIFMYKKKGAQPYGVNLYYKTKRSFIKPTVTTKLLGGFYCDAHADTVSSALAFHFSVTEKNVDNMG